MTTSFYSPEGAVLTKDPITVEVPVIEDQYADFYYKHFGGTNERGHYRASATQAQ